MPFTTQHLPLLADMALCDVLPSTNSGENKNLHRGKSLVETYRKIFEILDFLRIIAFRNLSGKRIGYVSDEAT